jgi:hypothetical protein
VNAKQGEEMRSYALLINEAELMARSPGDVYTWLKEYAERATLFVDEIDDEAETALRSRDEPLIDLGLARYSKNSSGVEILFNKALRADSSSANAQAIRLAALSNVAIFNSFDKLPGALFGRDDEALLAWLAKAEEPELAALFENPGIDQFFLREFLEQSEPWLALDERRLLCAMHAIATNPRMRRAYDDDIDGMDGMAEYSHNSVFNAAWKLAETLPVTPQWAIILGRLLNDMPEGSAVDNPLAIAERWRPPAGNAAAIDEESEYEKGGYLSKYQMVRCALAKAGSDCRHGDAADLLASNDPAVRAAAYEAMSLSVEQIMTGFERDKNLAVNLCQLNEGLWRHADKRRALHDVSWAILKYNDSHMDSANAFNRIEEQQRRNHPSWFTDDEPVEQCDLPPTKADIGAVIKAGERTREAWLEPIAAALVAMNKRITVIWWFSLGALVASAWRML